VATLLVSPPKSPDDSSKDMDGPRVDVWVRVVKHIPEERTKTCPPLEEYAEKRFPVVSIVQTC
jgi:hypothetical protein